MKLLLDSHAFLWWLEDSPRLGVAARRAIGGSAIAVSHASCWELGWKQAAGRLELTGDLFQHARDSDFDLLAIEGEDIRIANALPPVHRDPFDRMLVAQAQRRGLVLVTADAEIVRYGGAVLPA